MLIFQSSSRAENSEIGCLFHQAGPAPAQGKWSEKAMKLWPEVAIPNDFYVVFA